MNVKYAKLDEIGFVGYQDARSKAEVKSDAKQTAAFIKIYKLKNLKQKSSAKRKGIKVHTTN